MSRNGTAYHRLLNTARWRALRRRVLDASPFCADCRVDGVLTEATEVHHTVPVDEGATPERMAALAYDPGNLVALCRECHRKRHKALLSHSPATRRRRASEEAAAFWERVGDPPPGGVFQSPPAPSEIQPPTSFHACEKNPD